MGTSFWLGTQGGNWPLCRASQVNPLLQERIKKIYSYDAPGLNKAIIESDGYKAIANKFNTTFHKVLLWAWC